MKGSKIWGFTITYDFIWCLTGYILYDVYKTTKNRDMICVINHGWLMVDFFKGV